MIIIRRMLFISSNAERLQNICGKEIFLMKPVSVGDTIMFAYDKRDGSSKCKVHKSSPVLNFEATDSCVAIETVDGTVYVFVEEDEHEAD